MSTFVSREGGSKVCGGVWDNGLVLFHPSFLTATVLVVLVVTPAVFRPSMVRAASLVAPVIAANACADATISARAVLVIVMVVLVAFLRGVVAKRVGLLLLSHSFPVIRVPPVKSTLLLFKSVVAVVVVQIVEASVQAPPLIYKIFILAIDVVSGDSGDKTNPTVSFVGVGGGGFVGGGGSWFGRSLC